jgi:hypothetical protein
MRRGNNADCRKEATQVISNITVGATAQQLMDIYRMDVTGQLCDLLESQERFIVHAVLHVLVAFIDSGRQLGYLGQVADSIEECGVVETLEAIRLNGNTGAFQATQILGIIKGNVKNDSCTCSCILLTNDDSNISRSQARLRVQEKPARLSYLAEEHPSCLKYST